MRWLLLVAVVFAGITVAACGDEDLGASAGLNAAVIIPADAADDEVLVEALKTQQQIIERQQVQIGELQQGREVDQASLTTLQSRLAQIETTVQTLTRVQAGEPVARLTTAKEK